MVERLCSVFVKLYDEVAKLKFDNVGSKAEISDFAMSLITPAWALGAVYTKSLYREVNAFESGHYDRK